MFQLLQSTELVADSLGAVPKVEQVAQELTSGDVRWDQVMTQLVSWSLDAGKHILIAVVLFVIGHYLIKLLNYLLARFLERRKVEVTVQTFVRDFVGILLQVLLIITVVSALGVNTTSFAAPMQLSSFVSSAHLRTTLPISATASMLMPVFVEPMLTLEQRF